MHDRRHIPSGQEYMAVHYQLGGGAEFVWIRFPGSQIYLHPVVPFQFIQYTSCRGDQHITSDPVAGVSARG